MAWNFDGSSARLDAGNAASLGFDVGDPFAVSLWFRCADTNPAASECLFGKTQSGSPVGYWLFLDGDDPGDPLRLELTGDGYAIAKWGWSLDTAWHHLSLYYDGSGSTAGMTLWLDGQELTRTTLFDTGPTSILNSQHFCVGNRNETTSTHFNGDIAEFAIWNGSLGDAEIAVLARGYSPLCLWHRLPNLVVYQDLIRPLNRPGMGPALTAYGGTGVAAHPRMVYPTSYPLGGLHRLLYAVPYRLAAAAAHADRVTQGWAALAGAEQGTTYPIGEVSS